LELINLLIIGCGGFWVLIDYIICPHFGEEVFISKCDNFGGVHLIWGKWVGMEKGRRFRVEGKI
jgi:hypothetical protein